MQVSKLDDPIGLIHTATALGCDDYSAIKLPKLGKDSFFADAIQG